MKIPDIEAFVPSWLAHSTMYAVVITDLEGYYLYTNEIFKRNFAQNRDIIGMLATETIHREDVKKCEEAIRKCLQNPEKSISLFIRKSHHSNNSFYLTHWEFSALKSPNNELLGIICIGFDVSPINDIQRQLAISESKLRAVLESNSSSVILLSLDYQILLFNQVASDIAKEFFQKDIEEGKSFLPFVTESTREDFFSAFQKAIQGERTKMERKRIFKGKEIWLQIEYSPVYTDKQELIGVSLVTTNIDEQKRMQEQLQSSENKLRAIIDSTNDNNILLAPDYTVLSFNKAAAESVKMFFHTELQEGQDFRQYVVESLTEDFKRYFERALAGEVIKEEIEVKIDNKHCIWFMVSFYPVFDKTNKLIGVSYNTSNIDKAKKAELLLKNQNDRLKEIAYFQSHHMRRPVANILGLISILDRKNLSKDNEIIFGYLLKVSQELDKIIHQIVDKTQEI